MIRIAEHLRIQPGCLFSCFLRLSEKSLTSSLCQKKFKAALKFPELLKDLIKRYWCCSKKSLKNYALKFCLSSQLFFFFVSYKTEFKFSAAFKII